MSLKNKLRQWLFLDWDERPQPEPEPQPEHEAPDQVFSDILDQYSIVEVVPGTNSYGPFVVVTERNENSHVSPAGISYE